MSLAEIFTAAELEQQIRDVTSEIAKLSKRPGQQSIDGNFVSFQGKGSELLTLRNDLLAALKVRKARDAGSSAAQGPRQEI